MATSKTKGPMMGAYQLLCDAILVGPVTGSYNVFIPLPEGCTVKVSNIATLAGGLGGGALAVTLGRNGDTDSYVTSKSITTAIAHNAMDGIEANPDGTATVAQASQPYLQAVLTQTGGTGSLNVRLQVWGWIFEPPTTPAVLKRL